MQTKFCPFTRPSGQVKRAARSEGRRLGEDEGFMVLLVFCCEIVEGDMLLAGGRVAWWNLGGCRIEYVEGRGRLTP